MAKLNDKLVYTALYGNYDYLKDPIVINEDWDYICFTDNPKLESDYWKIVVFDHFKDPFWDSRNIKINIFDYAHHDIVLYLDASMTLTTDPYEILSKSDNYGLYMKLHPTRQTMRHEIAACVELEKDDSDKLYRQYEDYIKDGYNNDCALIEAGIFLAKREKDIITILNTWWKLLRNPDHSNRDQIALSMALYKHNAMVSFFWQFDYAKWVWLVDHLNKQDLNLPKITFFSPYANDCNIGAEYNRVIEESKTEWVCIMDGDVAFLDSFWGYRMAEAVTLYPDVDIFSVRMNRVKSDYQNIRSMYGNYNMIDHVKFAEERWKSYGHRVTKIEENIAGAVLLAKKSVFLDVRFKNGLIMVDTDFCIRAREKGYVFGIMEGIYVYHVYRTGNEGQNAKHLRYPRASRARKAKQSQKRLQENERHLRTFEVFPPIKKENDQEG